MNGRARVARSAANPLRPRINPFAARDAGIAIYCDGWAKAIVSRGSQPMPVAKKSTSTGWTARRSPLYSPPANGVPR